VISAVLLDPSPSMAASSGKVKGLTRPGSKIELAPAAGGSAPSHDDDVPTAVGEELVGRAVRKLFRGKGWFDGVITHYVQSSGVYRVRT